MRFGLTEGHYLLTAEQSRQAEECAIAETGVTLGELMERAGDAVAAEVQSRFPDLSVVVLVGPGNNGGDGWVAARLLHEAARNVRVLSLRDPAELSGIARAAADTAIAAGVRWDVPDTEPRADLLSGAVVVDALLGTGSTGELCDPLAGWVRAARAARAIVAVDVPTGVATDTGVVPGVAESGVTIDSRGLVIEAELTVTFSAPKRGLYLHPGAGVAGEVVVADIGVPTECLEMPGSPRLWSTATYLKAVPRPRADVNKFDRGRLLIVAGSQAYAGAAVLAARGAQRAGAGYVQLAVPEPVRAIAQVAAPAVVTVGLPAMSDGAFAADGVEQLLELAARADAVVCGPGLSSGPGPRAVVEALVYGDRRLVLDADGLNAFAGRGDELAAREAPTVITPHAGELARLLAVDSRQVLGDRVAAVTSLHSDHLVVVLKGAGTLIAGAGQVIVNPTGSVALASAGTGDVLAGVIGGLLVQMDWPLGAAALGVFLHGLAGELAAEGLSPISVTAEDVPDYVAAAIASLLEDWTVGNG